MWELGAGTTFLFFFPIIISFSLWQISKFVTPLQTNSIDTTGETTGRIKVLNLLNPASVFLCLRYWAELGVILCYVWICEKAPPLPHGNRFSSSLMFWGLWCLFMIWSLYNIVENKGGSKSATLLNREQSEEWKGWMQYLFLAYHYFHEASVYNAIRVFVSCYVWMTGFGNFSFFYTKADFGIVRLLQMMWRLNFLVFWLCLMFGNSFILYYINPLHTFYFLTTFLVMRIGYRYNLNKWKIRSKLFMWSLVIFVVWEFPTIFNNVWGIVLGTEPNPGAKSGTLHEWHFRSSLDHWSAIFGMIFALNYPAAAAWLKRVEGEPIKSTTTSNSINDDSNNNDGDDFDTKLEDLDLSDAEEDQPILNNNDTATDTTINVSPSLSNSVGILTQYSHGAKIIVLIPMLIGTMLYFIYVYPNDKKTYNSLHPYYFWIPLLTYVFVRNWSPCSRRYHSSSLAKMGKITLETYLMQHHIWLANDAKALYVVIPNAPFINLLVTTVTYVFVALRLFRITVVLRALHVSEIKNAGPWSCVINVSFVGVCIIIPYALSSALVASNSATTAGFIITGMMLTIILGALSVVAHFTCWKTYNNQIYSTTKCTSGSVDENVSNGKGEEDEKEERRICGRTPSCFTKIPFLLLIGSIAIQIGAHLIWPASGFDKMYHVNANILSYNFWYNRGSYVLNYKGIHEQGNSMIWKNTTNSVQLTKNRVISLYGDSLGRETLIGLGRLIFGQNSKNISFNLNDRHRNKFFQLSNGLKINFYWSPYIQNTSSLLKRNLQLSSKNQNEIVIISNGLWDMLHHPCHDSSCGGSNGAGSFATGIDNVLKIANTNYRIENINGRILFMAPTLVVPSNLPQKKKESMTIEAGWNYWQAIIDRKDSMDEILDCTTLTDVVPDLPALESEDGVHYEPFVYDNIAQGILNYIQKPIPYKQNDIRNDQKKLAGISHNAVLGVLVLIALSCMLITFDVYLGFSVLARIILGLPDIDLDHEYDKLHQTIKNVGKLW